MSRAADESLLGRAIAGKYVIDSFIGVGAMGGVYRARHGEIDKLVAVKVLHKELVREPQFTARFKREAKAASRLDHPNSMRVLDFGEEPDGLCYIVMELLDGKSLFEVLREEYPLANERIVELLGQTLAALAVAHEMGVVHRDLKPENIMVLRSTNDEGNDSEVVKVCDFGMATITASRNEAEPRTAEKLTSHGVVVGTPEYMSPEQGKGEELDGRSDIYSVGIILYQMLTGRLPFQAESAVAVLLKHLIEEPAPPSTLSPGVDRALEAVCMKAMRKRREERYATAREMRTALRVGPGRDGAPRSRALAARSVVITPAVFLGEAPTMQVAPPLSMRSQASTFHPTPRRSVRLARDILSDPPPPPQHSAMPAVIAAFLILIVAGGALAWKTKPAAARWTWGVPPWQGEAAISEAATPATTDPEVASAPASAPAVGASDAQGLVAPPVSAFVPQARAQADLDAAALAPASSSVHSPRREGLPGPVPPSPAPLFAAASDGAASAEDSATGAYATAHVVALEIKVAHANASDVRAALPFAQFDRCYRAALRAAPAPFGGAAALHLELDVQGVVTLATFAGLPPVASVGNCVAQAVTGRRVQNAEVGVTSADVDLAFQTE